VKTADFDYDLPAHFIAQAPVEPRDAARLLVLHRATGQLEHSHVRDLGRYLRPGDLLVLNNTRVIPARLLARKAATGGKAEILLLKATGSLTWEALVGGHGLGVGSALTLDGAEGVTATVRAIYDGPRRLVEFSQPIEPLLEQIGHVPLPPYIHTETSYRERYQTVYAQRAGSAAAPTAGLHFTPELLAALQAAGIEIAYVTLHVGLDTFAPVNEDDAATHAMHGEWCELPADVADRINAAKREGRRVVAVGTTSVRTLESAAQAAATGDAVAPLLGQTNLFILPGYTFKAVDVMLTNFHLPRSTLVMLVSAFAGRERVLAAYETAKAAGYRFYSFGDAMLMV
jgi:S-adenosylmethionine:tRNA ribosyltransferase-isomerase